MSYSPTIIAASLDDKELQASIDALVKKVNQGAKDMKTAMTSAVSYIKGQLFSLGKIPVTIGETHREKKALQETAQEAVKTAQSFNTLAQAKEKAIRGKRGVEYISLPSDVDKSLTYLVNVNKDVDAQMAAILQKEQELLNRKQEEVQVTRQIVDAQRGISGRSLGWGTVNDMQSNRRGTISANAQEIDYLRQQIAALLNIKEKDVQKTNIQYSTYAKLNQYLKQLQSAYHSLSFDLLKTEGRDIAQEIQRVQRALQMFQQQMMRPIDLKSAMGLSEKTLDDIAYKIQKLQQYRSGLDIKGQAGEISTVNNEITRLNKLQNDLLGKNKSLLESNNALARSWNYMKNRLAFYFTVGASTQFVKNLIDVRSQYELLERSIGILFDSMQTGTKIFAELNAMAIKSPFTTMELGAAAKQLSAYNIAAKDVVDTTRRLADIAAAVGIPIERLTYALGQIKSYGYLNSRDARMFANAGIPLIQNLADMYSTLEGRLVSIGDVYDRIKKKQISFEDTLKVINTMTDEGGRFFNFQEKAADTLKVKLANLTLAWNNMLNEMGKSNTGVINNTLGGLKKLFEHWRDIDAAIWGVVKVLGTLKAAQLAYYLSVKRTGIELALLQTFGAKAADMVRNLVLGLKSIALNPITWVSAAIVALGYLYQKYDDLQEENKEFNKSISDNAKENIDSIDKFFDKYKKEIDTIASTNTTDQGKMWERIRDEIEKTTKNAQQYIDILEKIPNTVERVNKASLFLEQQQVIQREAQRMADHGIFDLGGGFANDSLAKDLQEYENLMNDVLKEYESLEAAQKDYNDAFIAWTSNQYKVKYFQRAVDEAGKELRNFSSILDKVDIDAIKGKGTWQEMFANIRSFAQLVRDNFLATEEGQKISTEGQALLNREIDKWVAKWGVAYGLIGNVRAEVEANRSAWEQFFTYFSEEEKKAIDYLVSTGQTTTSEFEKIWNKAAKQMKESSKTAYDQIQNHIADLRNTAPIVIDIIYRENKGTSDEQIKQFEERFLTPKNIGTLTAERYLQIQKELTTKYGRFKRKEDEDNVEWEKRLGEEYQENINKIKSLNEQLKNSAQLSDADRKQKEKERDSLIEINKALDEVGDAQNFNYEQFAKGKKDGSKKDVLAEALQKEIQLVKQLQSDYDKLTKSGVTSMDALATIRRSYGSTISMLNATLKKAGLQGLDLDLIKGKNPREILKYFEGIKEKLEKSGLGNLKRMELVEGVIRTLRVDVQTYDMDKVTKGLNNELGKLKDEYELAIELDANPEMGDAFLQMFGIDRNELPQGIDDYITRVYAQFNKLRGLYGGVWGFDILKADADTWKEWGKAIGVTEEKLEELKKPYVDAQNVVKKWAQSTINSTQKLEYELAELDDKIAIKEKEKANLEEQKRKETNALQKHYLELAIQNQQKAIDELKAQALSLMPEYARVFNSIVEYSDGVARRLQRDLMKVYENGTYDSSTKTWTLVGGDGKPVQLSDTQYRKEREKLTREMRKSMSPFKKIKEAFKPSDEKGVVDYAKGIELVSQEVQKLGNVANEVGNFAKILFGDDDETVELINDIATSLNGVATAGQGLAQMASGDYIGGAASLLSGVVSVIGAWADNSNKAIDRKIKESETAVRRLELAYIDLEHAIDDAYGTATIGAERAAIANKQLQLVELKRQLQLEQSRKSKDKDEDRIIDLQKQIKELEYDIKDATNSIVEGLLGISSVGDAAENLVKSMIDSFKNGEDYMKSYSETFEDMIDNMIMKAIVGRVIGDEMNRIFERVEQIANERAGGRTATDAEIGIKLSRNGRGMTLDEWRKILTDMIGRYDPSNSRNSFSLEELQSALDKVNKLYSEAATPTPEDVDLIRQDVENWKDGVKTSFEAWMDAYGVTFGQSAERSLSNLQQGIQGITEDTASAIEAYMNIVSQRVFYHGTILEQIRDTIIGFNMDIQQSVQSQMLLQLQNSYTIQESIRNMLSGWSSANGNSIRVEMI